MTRKIIYIDNITGDEATVLGVDLYFGGVLYTWDLTDANHQALLNALDPWLIAADTISGARLAKPGSAAPNPTNTTTPTRQRNLTSDGRAIMASQREIRQWCAANGVPVNARDSLTRPAIDAFAAAHETFSPNRRATP